MTWFKIDDTFYDHPKVIELGLDVVGAWTLAGSWCARHLSDGAITLGQMRRLGVTEDHAQTLVDAGLWERIDERTFTFRDWHDYQPTRAEELERKRQARDRMRDLRARRQGVSANNEDVRANSTGSSDDVLDGDVANVPDSSSHDVRNPDPTRPDPVAEATERAPRKRGASSAKKATEIPEPFVVTRDMRDWAAKSVPNVDVDATTRVFVDYWRAEAGPRSRKKDWVAAWRVWLNREAKGGTSPRRPTEPPAPRRNRIKPGEDPYAD